MGGKMKNRSNLCDIIFEAITKDIIGGVLKPGDKLAGEYEFAEKYEVSRFTVREAMKKLDSMGLITIKHGIGSFVNEITPESFMKPLLPVLVMSNIDIREICEARLPLEVQSISLCIDRIDDDKLNEMRQQVEKMEKALAKKDFEKYNELDIGFHLLIAKASKNRVLFQMLNTLQDMLREQMKREMIVPSSSERSIRRHKQIIEAIERKEKELARQLMTLHINDSIDYLV
jgi:GntR family transcriptional repressor for pyruvate dehydrogenase complex